MDLRFNIQIHYDSSFEDCGAYVCRVRFFDFNVPKIWESSQLLVLVSLKTYTTVSSKTSQYSVGQVLYYQRYYLLEILYWKIITRQNIIFEWYEALFCWEIFLNYKFARVSIYLQHQCLTKYWFILLFSVNNVNIWSDKSYIIEQMIGKKSFTNTPIVSNNVDSTDH